MVSLARNSLKFAFLIIEILIFSQNSHPLLTHFSYSEDMLSNAKADE